MKSCNGHNPFHFLKAERDTHTHTLGTQAGCTPKVVLEAGKGCRLRIGSQNQQAVKDGYSRKGWEIKAISLVLQPPTE